MPEESQEAYILTGWIGMHNISCKIFTACVGSSQFFISADKFISCSMIFFLIIASVKEDLFKFSVVPACILDVMNCEYGENVYV